MYMSNTARAPASAVIPDRVKLLLVDDDRDNLLALQAVLEPLRQELMLAESGTDALRLCLEHDFAAILLDVRMPELDGFETAELIRARKRSRQTPILFLTAYRSDEQLFRGYDMGAVDFLFKPIVPEILQSKVSVFVELSRTTQLLQQQAEERARAERKFRSVLEAAPDAMVITREDGIVELANSRADALFGYSRETLIGRDIRTLIPGWSCSNLVPEGPGAAYGVTEERMTGVRQNSSSFPADITRSPLTTPEAVLITTAIRDATDQVQAEDRIRKLNLELEKRVAVRTHELTQSNTALQQFAWAASHDLQEPIRTVLSYSQWLSQTLNGSLGERETKMMQMIEEHANRMHQLLAALRQYVHVSESGQQEWKEVDCNTALKTAISTLEGVIQETGARIECEELPRIASIEILLIQLFQNLIGNGIKYRSSEVPVIRVFARHTESGWLFTVQDNGIGIDEKYADYIFGVFRRLHGVQYSGTGIGLAICKAAVERLGGKIWVESQAGSGASFHFLLPERIHEKHQASASVSG
jgi:PAS domain S-box-containing protein